MSDSDVSPSPLRTVGEYVKRYWHWPVLLIGALYVYQQYMPSIELNDPGRPAPKVDAETLDGDRFRMQDHRGDVVVVNVWATWCAPCRVEMPGFVDLQSDYRDEGVQFVGIAVDRAGAEVVRPYVEEEGINFPQIANPSVAAQHFPGDVVPRTYVIDRQGRVRYEHSGVLLKWALDDAIEDLLDEAPAKETQAARLESNGPEASPALDGT